MKVMIDGDERYPCYEIVHGYGTEIEITEDEFRAIEAARVEWEKWQEFMGVKELDAFYNIHPEWRPGG